MWQRWAEACMPLVNCPTTALRWRPSTFIRETAHWDETIPTYECLPWQQATEEEKEAELALWERAWREWNAIKTEDEEDTDEEEWLRHRAEEPDTEDEWEPHVATEEEKRMMLETEQQLADFERRMTEATYQDVLQEMQQEQQQPGMETDESEPETGASPGTTPPNSQTTN